MQQKLWGFTPHFSEVYVIFAYFFFGLILIAFGIVLLFESMQVKQARLRYDDIRLPNGSWDFNPSVTYTATENWDS